ncbi:MAG: CRISPR-associated protein Cas4, partial [Planctomycetes bacterium]|nr:CRISPR-associated protein Cas4 [Planctomycetota bacterium]
FPVEYKRGKPKRNNCDRVQLCAQALCLQEMLDADIPVGALFYGTTRRRVDVPLDAALRAETEAAARRLHGLIDTGVTPKADVGRWCRKCSLAAECMPNSAGRAKSARRYLDAAVSRITDQPP